jgi:hypothetical protein
VLGLDSTGRMALPLGSTCRCMMGGAVLAAMRRTKEAVRGLRDSQDGLQDDGQTAERLHVWTMP